MHRVCFEEDSRGNMKWMLLKVGLTQLGKMLILKKLFILMESHSPSPAPTEVMKKSFRMNRQ